MSKNQIVKSESEGYGYNYASLSDIVKQGYELPVMETKVVEGQLYMGWLDKENHWHQGAPVIVPEMKGMNAAQAMGSALTYSRRFTAQLALGLACDDDSKLEKGKNGAEPTGRVYKTSGINFEEVRGKLKGIQNVADLTKYWNSMKLSQKQAEILKKDFAKRREELSSKEIGGKDGVE